MCHLSVDFAVFGSNEQASECIDHEFIDFIHTVLKVESSISSMHVAVMQDNCLEDCSSCKLQLLSSLDQPFNEHLTHLSQLQFSLWVLKKENLPARIACLPRLAHCSCIGHRMCARFLSLESNTGNFPFHFLLSSRHSTMLTDLIKRFSSWL